VTKLCKEKDSKVFEEGSKKQRNKDAKVSRRDAPQCVYVI
jgi:hypothetical protein